MRIAEVAFPVPLPRTFHYWVPESMPLLAGMRVRAPFGPRRLLGVVTAFSEETPSRPLKTIETMVDARPALSAEALACAHFMSRRFGAPIGEAIKALLPSYVKSLEETVDLQPNPNPICEQPLSLTEGQSDVLTRLETVLDSKRHARAVLFGVPASGKTEVYLRLIRHAIAEGGQALFLLPEISLTRPFFTQFAASLSVPVALWHSGMTVRERRRSWLAVSRGQARVVVGTRSACLLPFSNLRFIIMDEEQDESFKQDGASPYYHARDVSLARAEVFNAVVLMGSATPSIEAWSMARSGRAQFYQMPQRVSGTPPPRIRILPSPERGQIMCAEMVQALASRLELGEQSILMVNRRGFTTLTICSACRWIDRCPDCGVAKIRHQQHTGGSPGWVMMCHRCGRNWPTSVACGACGKTSLRETGIGTQRLAQEVKSLFPRARVLRMDRDTVSREAKIEERIYDQFRSGKADILVGTKLVAKSFHFPQVTLVGVIDVDSMLHMPDFRCAEHTMQLLTQVAGRSGRAEKPGEVLLQTLSLEHDAIKALVMGDYANWADRELAARSELSYPPAAGLTRVVISAAKNEEKAQDAAQSMVAALRESLASDVEIIGPAPAVLLEVRGRFRYHFLIKYAWVRHDDVLRAARGWAVPAGVRVSVDSDPYDML